MQVENHQKTFYEKYTKRLLDFSTALLALILLSPLILLLWFIVRLKLGAPAIFTQERPGYKGKIFKLYKFRSMSNTKDASGKLLPDEARLTPFGKLLRASSLDELPELFNILKGDLSFVGPRPLLVQYLPLYNKRQARRHDVRPGLTGLAQVNGRNAISWEEKFEYDVQYVDTISFLGDLKIFLQTFQKAFLSREGISAEGSATIEDFTGTKENNME